MILLLLACLPDLGPRSAIANNNCASCHPQHADQFSHSRHAIAHNTPVFNGLMKTMPAQTQQLCDTCHRPDHAPFSCLTCHAAVANQQPKNGQLLWDPTGPVYGPSGESKGPHASALGEFLTDSELCATCHEVDGPGVFSEHPWTNGRELVNNRCQDCHMPNSRRGIVEEGRPWEVSDHSFQGIAAGDEASLSLLRSGLSMTLHDSTLTLSNLTGHLYPDGAAHFRELWIEIGDSTVWLSPLVSSEPYIEAEATFRALKPREVRTIPTTSSTACLYYRPMSARLADELNQALPEALLVQCVSEEAAEAAHPPAP